MFANVPVIGLSGGIGSGKSFVGRLFAELNCAVICSDEMVRRAYDRDDVKRELREWWGEAVFQDGTVNRRAVADRIFVSPEARRRLELLIHPVVNDIRRAEMHAAVVNDFPPHAFVWDSPLLFETGLDRECDALVYIDCPAELRLARVARDRGWTADELARRENSQIALDKKREMSNYSLVNTADAAHIRDQVRNLLPRIIEQVSPAPAQETSREVVPTPFKH